MAAECSVRDVSVAEPHPVLTSPPSHWHLSPNDPGDGTDTRVVSARMPTHHMHLRCGLCDSPWEPGLYM